MNNLFNALKKANYYWQPKTPDQLLVARKAPQQFRALERYFGLGLVVEKKDLVSDGLDQNVASGLSETPTFAISSDMEGEYLIHDHWPPVKGAENEYVHLGVESFHVARQIESLSTHLAAGLDLGCSSGVLSFSLSKKCDYVLGIDSASRAIDFAEKTRTLRGIEHCRFLHHKISGENLPKFQKKFDLIVFNPPLGIPEDKNPRPHRDGGYLGIEVPLMFLDFAYLHAAKGARCFFIAGDPVLAGEKVFQKKIKEKGEWNIDSRDVIESHFNQSVARAHGYDKFGIERIELVLYKLSLI